MSGQTAVVIGSTGMIGDLVVKQLIDDPTFTHVRLLVRRPILFHESKIEVKLVNFEDPADMDQQMGSGDCIFCCVGTTQSKVKGDKNAYRKVDFDIPVNSAKTGLKNGFSKFLLVSAVGANHDSGNFYLKLKGETEEALKKINFPSLHIFQPSLLLGERNESRITEKIAQVLMPAFSFMLAGKLKKYKPVKAMNVARAMVNAAKSEKKGIQVYQYAEIEALAQNH
ncbi:NAD(P)H-binding protein [Flavitalea sp.]|nr:NAD(P)H-binding protein [Flavitalea sp.]